MNTTVSMWLGLSFVVLAVSAVLLQAWLWGPAFWDDEARKTRAPRTWLRVHACCGYAYALIYVVMMVEMVPRLWHYQSELPARTVMHATAAIVIGVILITKIAILRFFRHFEEAMPRLGFGLLLATVVLGTLSLPFAVQAHDLQGSALQPDNRTRVSRVLESLDGVSADQAARWSSVDGLERGRDALVSRCTYCHDIRTILSKPRTGKRWYDVVVRMQEKPAVMGAAIDNEDVPLVAAYLIAITPDIQRSTKRKMARDRESAKIMQAMKAMSSEASGAAPAAPSGTDAAAPGRRRPPLRVDPAEGQALLERRCTDCHELDELDEHGGDDLEGWTRVVGRMLEIGAELSMPEIERLTAHLARQRPRGETRK